MKKKTDPSHKKILRIALTAKGKQILEACNRELDIMEGKFLTGLTSKEIETMKNLIGKILNSLREDAS